MMAVLVQWFGGQGGAATWPPGEDRLEPEEEEASGKKQPGF